MSDIDKTNKLRERLSTLKDDEKNIETGKEAIRAIASLFRELLAIGSFVFAQHIIFNRLNITPFTIGEACVLWVSFFMTIDSIKRIFKK